MNGKERIERFLELQEHPERLTDGQARQMFADEGMRQLVRQLGFAKRALKNQEANGHDPNVDGEWERFAAIHARELDALDKGNGRRKLYFLLLHSPFRKLAASFIAVLVASGLALAAIHIARQYQRQDVPSDANKTAVADTTMASARQAPAATQQQDTIATKTRNFVNVPLDEMLKEIASAYHAEVDFENGSARSLRFHFVWKRRDSLATVVRKLNTFEVVNITMDDNKLIVR